MRIILRILGFYLLAVIIVNNSFAQNASFNYSIQTGAVGTTYSWIDCSGGTEITSFTGGSDDGHAEISWPFDFRFYDDSYTSSNQLSIGTNGFIRLDGIASTSYTDAVNYDLTSSATSFGQLVALCLYDDNFGDAGSHLYYLISGSSPNRVLTVEYSNVEIDWNDGKYADVQVSFYETSNRVVIKFRTDDITKNGVDMGIHSGVSGYFDKWQEVLSGTNNTWIEYSPPKRLKSIVYNQASTLDVYPGEKDAEVIRLDVSVEGATGSLNLNSIQITANNSSDADIASSGVKLYYTTSSTFIKDNLLGTAQSLSSSTATFSSLNYDLPVGVTYIWVVYDISSSASMNIGHTVDMSIATNAINIAGSTYPSTSQNPTGTRSIAMLEWDGSTSTDWTDGTNWTSNVAPTSTDNVYIPQAPTNQPHLPTTYNGYCNNLYIASGASLTIENSNKNLNVYGDIINDGTLSVTGTYNILLRGTDNVLKGAGTYSSDVKFRLRGTATVYTLETDMSIYRFDIFANDADCILNINDRTLTCNNRIRNSSTSSTVNVTTGVAETEGTFVMDGTFNAGTGTVYYSKAGNQTIKDVSYYNLKLGGSGTKTSAAALNVDGELTIETSTTLNQGGYSINLAGDWTNNGTFTQGTQTVTLDGSSAQTIGGSSTTTFYDLTLNNSAGITLNHTTNISNTLTFTAGLLNTTSSNLLVIGSSASAVSGANSSRYIDGPVRKDGSSDFVFPVGDGGKYAPIGVANLSASETFTAEYFKATPSNNTTYDYPITKVSDNEYWDLSRSGTATADVTLNFLDASWSGITSTTDLRVVHWNGTKWEDLGNNANTSSSITVTGVSSFSPFSFGTINNVSNPLPIELLSFNAKADNKVVLVDWQTATETNNEYFIVERSKDGINSERIGTVQGAGNSNEVLNYEFVDQNPYSGTSYYRLTQVDYNGQSETFDWVAVNRAADDEPSIQMYPNPLTGGMLNIDFNNIDENVQLSIYDFSGRLVYNRSVDAGQTNIQLAIDLAQGTYSIQIVGSQMLITKKLIVN